MPGGNIIYNLYPVPNNGQFTISIMTDERQLFNVSVYNPLGQKILDITDLSVYGEYKIPVKLKTVDSGLYFVKFKTKDGQEVRRMSVYQY
jgi:hypothetical protein